jgi:hypothetical protein
MLDPLSALSVASSVVSFVDFVLDLVKDADAIRNKGSSTRVSHNKIVTSDLISINAALRARIPDRLRSAEFLQKEEQVRFAPSWSLRFAILFRLCCFVMSLE